MGYTENDEDVQIVFEFMDDIRDAVTDYQVSVSLKAFSVPPFMRPVQTAYQQAMYDLDLKLIVSHQNGSM